MIYMDNSATSFPKPEGVRKSVIESYDKLFANAGRASHKASVKSASEVYKSREALAHFVNTIPENIVFTYNATYALNMAIFGTVGEGDRVVTSVFEHNSVLRPLFFLEKEKGVKISFFTPDISDKSVTVSNFEKMIKKPEKPSVLVLTHTSNVIGYRFPIKEIGELCQRENILFILDASQGLGTSEIDLDKLGVDILCSSGHKGIYGVSGSGFMALSRKCRTNPIPYMMGGSGVFSREKHMPDQSPERFEAGTLGVIGIASMRAGVEYIEERGIEEIAYEASRVRKYLIEGMSTLPALELICPETDALSIILFKGKKLSPDTIAQVLDEEDIAVRAGFHCAPLAHEYLSTGGAVRISVSHFNTLEECDKVLRVLSRIK